MTNDKTQMTKTKTKTKTTKTKAKAEDKSKRQRQKTTAEGIDEHKSKRHIKVFTTHHIFA